MRIEQVANKEEKKKIAREVLEDLKEWFGIDEAREEYIEKSKEHPFWAAFDGERNVGFLYLVETGKDTVELYVIGVKKEYQHSGIGKKMFQEALEAAKASGYHFIQVKTVQRGNYESYDRTNDFYDSLGFKEFEVFPTLWDEWNPCQIYVMAI